LEEAEVEVEGAEGQLVVEEGVVVEQPCFRRRKIPSL